MTPRAGGGEWARRLALRVSAQGDYNIIGALRAFPVVAHLLAVHTLGIVSSAVRVMFGWREMGARRWRGYSVSRMLPRMD